MRANRTYGSEGGESQALPDPYHAPGSKSPGARLRITKKKDVDGRDEPGHDGVVRQSMQLL